VSSGPQTQWKTRDRRKSGTTSPRTQLRCKLDALNEQLIRDSLI
jgi:hypothetical protein